jgi:phosphopentomutase
MSKKRAIILVIDACGIGSMPDWAEFDEVTPSNTLKNTCKWILDNSRPIKLPHLQQLGIANIDALPGLDSVSNPKASYGKMAELNYAKDTITGHWEMCSVKAKQAFPYYPNGFPDEILEEFKKRTGTQGILCNAPASGTEVINTLGDEHNKTGYPIIYTSADSVLQIACDVEVVDLETQYKWCEIAREIMREEHEVARIIARPFSTNPNYIPGSSKAAEMKYIRLGDKRHDYSVLPHGKSILETVIENNGHVIGLGKIQDIFAGVGVPENIHTKNNSDGLDKLIQVIKETKENSNTRLTQGIKNDKEVIFINLVETDSNYGHRRDPEGFAKALEAIDERIPELLEAMTEDDILLISADHGCDPTATGTDHTREYVPILLYGQKNIAKNLETRDSFADIGATILEWFNLQDTKLGIQAKSML